MRNQRLSKKQATNTWVFPFSLVLKLLLAMIFVLFLAMGVIGTILEDELTTVLGSLFVSRGMVSRLIRLIQMMGFSGTILTLGSFFLVYVRGLAHYRRLCERAMGMVKNENTYQNLDVITFPDEDMLGNLGQILNQLMKQITYFDHLKTSALRRTQERFEFVADLSSIPLLLLFLKKSFPTPVLAIRYANRAFLELFAKKRDGEFFDIVGLSVEVSELDEGMSSSTIGERFEKMYQAEMAEIAFLNKKILYMVNQTLATFSPQVLTERQEIVPLHEDNQELEVVVCKRLEFYPFVDVIKGEEGKKTRAVKEVLLVFRDYETSKGGIFSALKKLGKKEEK